MIGRTIKDRYEIVAKIGEGGMGVVYKAIDKELQRPVALKMLHHAHSSEEMLKVRFEIEARALANLNHRSIVTLFDYFKLEENHFLVMELLEGKTGKDLLEEKEVIPFPELIRMFRSVMDGLAYAHRRGIIHRDIKPNNIMIMNSGEVKIMDFGIARRMNSPQVTQVGYAVGSALYMSPEQIKNQQVDHRSDIYSLGITMFEMATGKAPFLDADSSEYNIMLRHLSSELPSSRALNPDIPETLEKAIIKATQKNPEDRFQTMDELALALTSDPEVTKVKPIVPPISPIQESRAEYFPKTPPRRSLFSDMSKGSLFLIVVVFASLALIGTLAVRWFNESQEKHDIVPSDRQPAKPAVEKPEPRALPGEPYSPGAKTTDAAKPIPTEPALAPPQSQAPVGIAKFKAMYLAKGKGAQELKEAGTLTSQDRYYVVLSPDETAYVYVAQIDTADVISPIFPNPQFSSRSNPLAPNAEYRFPEKEYFFLGGGQGKERLYVIASRGPNEKLDSIYRELRSADDVRSKQLAREFIEIFNQQELNSARALWFWHG